MLTATIDINALCTQAESLCRWIAPLDLGDSPLYIVPQSRLPDELGGKAVCDGFFAPRLDCKRPSWACAENMAAVAVWAGGATAEQPRTMCWIAG